MEGSMLFRTKREELIESFKNAGKPFVATTKPYKSTKTVVFDVVDGGNGVAYAVAAAQQHNFFDYNIGGAVADGFGGNFQAPDSWTNMQKASQTNGATRFVIEGISMVYRNARFQYPANSLGVGVTNAIVKAWAYGANGAVPPQGLDPAALVAPPQLHSPFNLENAIAQSFARCCSVYFQFDQERTDLLGSLDEFPEGGASSFLRSNGQPRFDNRYRMPEGYLWREAGKPDSSLNVQVNLRESIVIPLTLIIPPGAEAVITPTKLAIDCTMRLHGLAVRPPSDN